jgi:Fe-S-cluster-containing hydrogenase component 2
MNGSGDGNTDPALVRCAGCALIRCAVFCDKNAIVPVCGDILVETRKCLDCDRRGENRMPGCVASCPNAVEKHIAGDESAEQKQTRAASIMTLWTPIA